MFKRNNDLYPSLVGSHIEFRTKGEVVTLHVEATRADITKEVELAMSVITILSIPLLAEMLCFYSTQPYFGAVRSAITLRRLHADVEKTLETPIDKRFAEYKKLLSSKAVNRDILLHVLRYVVKVRPSYLKELKHLLTKEEYYYVA